MNFDLHSDLAHLPGLPREVRRGEVLVREGEAASTLFVVRSGRLRALLCSDRPEPQLVGDIGAGEIFGELAVLTAAPRSATVVALRDSVVTEVSGADLARLPSQVLFEIMRMLAERMRGLINGDGKRAMPRCITLLAASPNLPLVEVARAMIGVAAPLGRNCLALSESDLPDDLRRPGGAASDVGRWLSHREEEGTLILQTDYEATEWTRRCLLQADRVIVVGRAAEDPELSPGERALLELGEIMTRPEVDLVLLQHDLPYRGTARWLERRRIRDHFHVRPHVSADRERMARQLFGANLSVALGGGGARGFAHVGLLRACEEMALPVDRVGGTSIGSIVGGLAAMGLASSEIKERLRAGFVPSRKLKNWTWPVIAFDTSCGYQAALHHLYGDALIEDQPVNYYCVSCNLTRARQEVHRRGPLWKWVGASISYPLLAPPLVVNGEMLVDGGLLNNVPADIARADGAGFVLGVDVGASNAFKLPDTYNGRPQAGEVLWSRLRQRAGGSPKAGGPTRVVFPTLIDLISRTCMLGSMIGHERARPHADLFLRMPVDAYRLLDFDRIDEIAEIGYQTALTGLQPVQEWRRLKSVR